MKKAETRGQKICIKGKKKDFDSMSLAEISELGEIRDEVFDSLSNKQLSYHKVKIILNDINSKYKEIANKAVIRNADIILHEPEIKTIPIYQDKYPWWLVVINLITVLIAVIIAVLK